MNKKTFSVILSVSIFVLMAGGCARSEPLSPSPSATSQENENKNYYKITAGQAKDKLDGQTGAILADIRGKSEYEEKHIPGAVLVQEETLSDTFPGFPLKGDIIIYSRNDTDSKNAADKLIKMGYENIYDIGSIDNWEYGTESGEYKGAASLTGEFKAFSSTTLDGLKVDQDILSYADLTILNIWGTFCGPCINEMPHLGELAEEYKDKKVQFIGVVIDVTDMSGNLSESQIEKAVNIVKQTKADYLHILPQMI